MFSCAPAKFCAPLAIWAALAAPRALACAVCGAGQRDPSATAFTIGTAILSLMPLSMIGGVICYVTRRYRALQAEAVGSPLATAEVLGPSLLDSDALAKGPS